METPVQQKGMITVRYGSVDDVQLLIDLGTRTFQDTFAAVNTQEDMDLYVKKNFSAAQIMSEVRNTDNIFLIAESGGKPAGYAKLRRGHVPDELRGRHALEIERLYATTEFIGKQVGYTLMQKCLAIANDQQYDTIWLGVWEHNHRAIAFYMKCGFAKFGSHPFMLGNDLQTDHLMKKDLG
jgi:ribosomal protein S18 acetylase RimI-like enzyme